MYRFLSLSIFKEKCYKVFIGRVNIHDFGGQLMKIVISSPRFETSTNVISKASLYIQLRPIRTFEDPTCVHRRCVHSYNGVTVNPARRKKNT